MPDVPLVNTVDDYIALFPPEVQATLRELYGIIKSAAPEATERISYGVPTFDVKTHVLMTFAGYDRDVSMFPVPVGSDELKAELAPYVAGRGTVLFPLDTPLPEDLIRRVLAFRLAEIERKIAG